MFSGSIMCRLFQWSFEGTQYALGHQKNLSFLERLHDGQRAEPRHEKTNVLVFDQVRHKPGCTVTEDG